MSHQQRHSSATHRFARRRSGAGLPEYAIVLAVATTVVAMGAVVLFAGFRQFTGHAATALFDSSAAGNAARGHGLSKGPAQPGRQTMMADDAPPADVAGVQASLIAVSLAVGVLGIAGLTILRRRRKARSRESAAEDLANPAATEPIHVRAFQKRQQLWRAILTDGERLLRDGMEVRHLMTRDLLKVRPAATMEEIRRVMASSRVHHLLVCDGDRLVGIISDRDLRGRENYSARDVMRSPVHTVTPGMGLGSAIHMLIEKNISCLPVLDAGQLCGILSTTDLILTLQCSLQLWLRMARASGNDYSLIAEQHDDPQSLECEVALQHEG